MASKVHLISRGPSPLGDNGAVGRPATIVQEWRGLERNAWRRALHQVGIVRDVPCTLVAYYPIVSLEVLERRCPEQEHQVVVCVLGCKCASEESVGDDVASEGVALLLIHER